MPNSYFANMCPWSLKKKKNIYILTVVGAEKEKVALLGF